MSDRQKAKKITSETSEGAVKRQLPVCGVVMPISAIDGCSESHWTEVLAILTESVETAGYQANIVSNADDVGIIQKRIIQNLYDNPIVVCDVSGKNPNVMFELGMRLAFDKPTIIVKDDKTDYSFDTSPIEHLEYPRDLRFRKIVEFKKDLAKKIQSTLKASQENPKYTTFLKHFGEFKVAKIDEKEVSGQEFLIEELSSIKVQLARLTARAERERPLYKSSRGDICLRGLSNKKAQQFADQVVQHAGVRDVSLRELRSNHFHLKFQREPSWYEGIDELTRDIEIDLERFKVETEMNR